MVLLAIPPMFGGKPLPERKIKAAFLLKFLDFVEWPAVDGTAGSSPIRLGILGNDPFTDILPGEVPGGTPDRPMVLILRLPLDSGNASTCRVLYFPDEESQQAEALLEKIKTLPILTIGEGKSFLKRGGIIGFTLENNRVAFLISLKNARLANLEISSKLLRLALRVFQ